MNNAEVTETNRSNSTDPTSFEEWINYKYGTEQEFYSKAALAQFLIDQEYGGDSEGLINDAVDEYTEYCEDNNLLVDLPTYLD